MCYNNIVESLRSFAVAELFFIYVRCIVVFSLKDYVKMRLHYEIHGNLNDNQKKILNFFCNKYPECKMFESTMKNSVLN